MSHRRRLVVAVGIAAGWYAAMTLLIYGLSRILGQTHDIEPLVHLLLFPLGLLSWLAMLATNQFGIVAEGEMQLPASVVRALTVVLPILHFLLVTLMAYGAVTWRVVRRARGSSAAQHA